MGGMREQVRGLGSGVALCAMCCGDNGLDGIGEEVR